MYCGLAQSSPPNLISPPYQQVLQPNRVTPNNSYHTHPKAWFSHVPSGVATQPSQAHPVFTGRYCNLPQPWNPALVSAFTLH